MSRIPYYYIMSYSRYASWGGFRGDCLACILGCYSKQIECSGYGFLSSDTSLPFESRPEDGGIRFFLTLVSFSKNTRYHNAEDHSMNVHRSGNLNNFIQFELLSFGHCPSTGILKIREYDVSESIPVSEALCVLVFRIPEDG